MDAHGFEVAADPPGLDVDDLGGAELDRVDRGLHRHDRLVEADRRRRRAGQLGVPEDVLLRQRLLDQQQVELVELAEVGDVVARVGRVGVDLERHVGADQVADQAHRLDVPTGLDLELDAHVPVGDVAGDLA